MDVSEFINEWDDYTVEELINDLSKTVNGMKYAAYKEDSDLMLEIISDSQTCLDALESLMLDRNTDQQ
jgi:hypothetical protein|tara:strand:- start:41 stop:244 length:204 start_codon:yes stop_codon:yes gene_type:complete